MTLILGEGSKKDKDSLALATRRGNHIVNLIKKTDDPPARLRAARIHWQAYKPNATLRSLTALYNCMGMVFACRRTTIDINQIDFILSDDGYTKLRSLGDTEIGDVVIYINDSNIKKHVGIIMKKERLGESDIITVMSQWGFDGEYIHNINYVPDIYGTPREFWTDRK